jgi:hypothetical protein
VYVSPEPIVFGPILKIKECASTYFLDEKICVADFRMFEPKFPLLHRIHTVPGAVQRTKK